MFRGCHGTAIVTLSLELGASVWTSYNSISFAVR